MVLIIKISQSKQIIFNTKNLLLFNELSSQIIKDFTKSKYKKIDIYIYFDKEFFYYIIKYNNYTYAGKINSNYLNFSISFI